ncbi:MAG TPA: hypothetical protein VHH73_03105 [Verrucomicrobiae bacterium]|nr:hypothetical protein [Verrucomicrobiae bacterium]
MSSLAVAGAVGLAPGPALRVTAASSRRKKVAILGTVVRKHSHAQHFIDRFLEGYGWEGGHHWPDMEVSLYIDQFPPEDLARERAQRHKIRIYPTVEEALTLGGSKLAVDGVLIIGEHGDYPRNHRNQTLYPRYKFFKQIVGVFERSGRAVPVFNDKHLSTDWNECHEMVADSKRLHFPFLAGSSLPVTWRIPSIDFPHGAPLAESLAICYGGVDSYDFHGLETAQCMSERRAGGETGVAAIQAVTGQKVLDLIEQRPDTKSLLFAALARSHTVKGRPGYTFGVPDMGWLRENSSTFTGYFIDHRDGLRTTMLLCNSLVRDFTYAGLRQDDHQVISCQMHLPMPNHISTTADFFNPLVHHVEQMIHTGKVPYPVERTLLTSGMTLKAVESLWREQARIETPELDVRYAVSPTSTYWRA